MITGPLIIATACVYLGLLFAIAWWADRRAERGQSVIGNPTVYALSLAVYCTAWTFYGSVGRATVLGPGFLAIYVGPTLIALLWSAVLVKMIRVSKTQRITSIADFIASRYGMSQLLGGLVTVIAVCGVVPYIALQLKAITWSYTILLAYPQVQMPQDLDLPFWQDTGFIVALLLAAFTILFGTRHLDASERHEGMVAAIAFESIVKLVAFLAVGLWVTLGLLGLGDTIGGPALPPAAGDPRLTPLLDPSIQSPVDWFAIVLLSGLAVMLLPRQFQVAVVEISDERLVRRAIWLFPLYLLLINLFVIPIALAGLLAFPAGQVNPDTFVLSLPMAFGHPGLALLVFIGGLSAAAAMVIVEVIALSTMVSNDLVLPVLLRHWNRLHTGMNMGRLLLVIRRAAILVILLLGWLYYRLAGDAYALVGIGLISFAAVAQFAPVVFAALYWRGGTREGALAGLSAGFLVWIYTLLLPSFARSGWLPPMFLESGIFGIDFLKPQAMFWLADWNEVTHCLFWSLTANLGAFLLVSSLRPPNAAEATQASAYVDAFKHGRRIGLPLWRGNAEVAKLRALAERFLGPKRTRRVFRGFARSRGIDTPESLPADAETVAFVETLLSGAIGGASARAVVASVTEEETLGVDEVLEILDEATQIRAYSRDLEQKSRELEAASAELRAVNERLQELDRLKDDFMSSVSHELRTPLASIRAFAEILYDDPQLDLAERTNFLGIMVSETKRLSRLVNQVLDLAKIESGHADWLIEPIDLREVITQSVAATGQLIQERGAELLVDLGVTGHPEAVPESTPQSIPQSTQVLADRDRLVQVLVNLLSNAAKFVPTAGGRVEVRLSRQGERLLVCVTDNGPGIPAADVQLVFEKFRQAASGGEKPIGTGLGLPICRQIVENFGGRIWAEAGRPAGARLCFELPALAAAAPKHNEPGPLGEGHTDPAPPSTEGKP
jgi:Na+/proline symporter/signal transduction histidine kinase